MSILILFSVFFVSTCGLVYEFISAAIASYTLGDTVTQFSLVIGFYLFAMGCGSYLSKYVQSNPIARFIQIELLIAILGGMLPIYLFGIYPFTPHFKILLLSYISIIGVLVGIEIPLMMRILKDSLDFNELVSRVFAFDYIGALIASLSFPFIFMPFFGLIQTGLIFGFINALVALISIIYFKEQLLSYRFMLVKCGTVMAVLAGFFSQSALIEEFLDSLRFDEEVIFRKTTSYQKLVLTHSPSNLQLYINGNLQFASRDEYRYHEALVHVGLSQLTSPKRVLVLGGGDGLAAREILKYPSVEQIVLVDLDPEMTNLCKSIKPIADLNENSLKSKKVKVVNQDAFLWLKDAREKFDFVVIDFPDPSNYSLGKLYSRTFYHWLKRVLSEDALIVVQSTSPYVAPKSYWCVANTLKSVGFHTRSYSIYLPSFGIWGFHLATRSGSFKQTYHLPTLLKFITPDLIPGLFVQPHDRMYQETSVNDLNNQSLVRYFDEEWNKPL